VNIHLPEASPPSAVVYDLTLAELERKITQTDRVITAASSGQSVPTHTSEEMARRLAQYQKISKYIQSLSDVELQAILGDAVQLSVGIGGDVLKLELEGIPFVAKKIRLTREEQDTRSTSNYFALPTYYQYGVGSMGFGVWRELAAHEMTTQWVLNGECQNFPLMYGARVLQHSTNPKTVTEKECEEQKRYVTYWDNAQAIGDRQNAVLNATDNVVIFMEFIPQTLHKWLKGDTNEPRLDEETITRIERELLLVTEFMKAHGFIHFDAHLRNIFANDEHIYFSDFGLSQSLSFELSAEERAFFEEHQDYDRSFVALMLVRGCIRTALEIHHPMEERHRLDELVTEYLKTGKMPVTLSPVVVAIMERYRPIAVIMENFLQALCEKSKSTPYPVRELADEWQKIR
jgi:serine/threonine protein kinase